MQLQGLFTLRLEVLFIVRSHYLYAIGLPRVFCLRWCVPPVRAEFSICLTPSLAGQTTCACLCQVRDEAKTLYGENSLLLTDPKHAHVACTSHPVLSPEEESVGSTLGYSLFDRLY